jgi:hypothetical protein
MSESGTELPVSDVTLMVSIGGHRKAPLRLEVKRELTSIGEAEPERLPGTGSGGRPADATHIVSCCRSEG